MKQSTYKALLWCCLAAAATIGFKQQTSLSISLWSVLHPLSFIQSYFPTQQQHQQRWLVEARGVQRLTCCLVNMSAVYTWVCVFARMFTPPQRMRRRGPGWSRAVSLNSSTPNANRKPNSSRRPPQGPSRQQEHSSVLTNLSLQPTGTCTHAHKHTHTDTHL